MYITRVFLAIVFGVNILLGGAIGIPQANALSAPTAPTATIRYVDADAPGPGNGFSWATAFPSLQNALLVANSDDEIWVAEGVYYPDRGVGHPDDDPNNTFALKDNVQLYGGFDPQSGVDEFSERDWETYVTVLSGDIDQNDTVDSHGVVITTTHITGNNAYHVVTGNGVSDSAVVDGFVITAGQANSDYYPDYYGGGMYNNGSSPTLKNVIFAGNSAKEGGGITNNYESNPLLINVTFSNNTATGGDGGGMANYGQCNTTLTNVTFSGNSAAFHGGGFSNISESYATLENVTFSGNSSDHNGGGMYNGANSNATLNNVRFSNNLADYGGGVYTGDGNPTLTNVTFSGNSASHDGGGMALFTSNPIMTSVFFSSNIADGNGGGMVLYESVPTLMDATFFGNSAVYGGGVYNNENSYPNLTNVTFSGNSAEKGGGMYNSGKPILINVIFSGNRGDDGGGMYNLDSSPTLTNVTLARNFASNNGGGMFNEFASNPELTNTVFWLNLALNSGNQIRNETGSIPLISYSDIQGCGGSGVDWRDALGTDGGGNIQSDPLFVCNPDPGPDGQWDGVEDDYGDLHLRYGSLAIDSGTNSSCPATDLDSTPRPVNAICDMGAYEYLNLPPIAVDDFGFGFFTKKDTPFTTANVLTNDSDPNGDTLILQSFDTSSTKGLVFDNGDGAFNYDPNGQFDYLAHEIEFDSFFYTINDGHGGTDTAKVTIAVVGFNDAPVANDDSGTGFSTDEDTPFTSASVLANDSDPDGDALSLQSINTSGTKGLVSSNGDGTFNYDPNDQYEYLAVGETATDSFTYTISDGHGGADTATVTISIIGLQDESVIYLPLLER